MKVTTKAVICLNANTRMYAGTVQHNTKAPNATFVLGTMRKFDFLITQGLIDALRAISLPQGTGQEPVIVPAEVESGIDTHFGISGFDVTFVQAVANGRTRRRTVMTGGGVSKKLEYMTLAMEEALKQFNDPDYTTEFESVPSPALAEFERAIPIGSVGYVTYGGVYKHGVMFGGEKGLSFTPRTNDILSLADGLEEILVTGQDAGESMYTVVNGRDYPYVLTVTVQRYGRPGAQAITRRLVIQAAGAQPVCPELGSVEMAFSTPLIKELIMQLREMHSYVTIAEAKSGIWGHHWAS